MRTVLLIIVLGLLVGVQASRLVAADVTDSVDAAASSDGGTPNAPSAGNTGDSGDQWGSTEALIASLTIFVLAVFVGFEVITKVPPTLHTPLMSGSNAISGITVVGALLAAGAEDDKIAAVLGMVAVAMATINVVGGFLVTHRMLGMFRKK